MRLTDFLRDLGRPLPYYAALTDITGSINATLVLCHLASWLGHQADPEGWIYKKQDEWWTELRISRHELDSARRQLRDRGFLAEERRGIPARLYYRLDLDAVNDAWERHAGSPQTSLPESGKLDGRKAADSPAEIRQSNTVPTQITPRVVEDPAPLTLAQRLEAASKPGAVRPRRPV